MIEYSLRVPYSYRYVAWVHEPVDFTHLKFTGTSIERKGYWYVDGSGYASVAVGTAWFECYPNPDMKFSGHTVRLSQDGRVEGFSLADTLVLERLVKRIPRIQFNEKLTRVTVTL